MLQHYVISSIAYYRKVLLISSSHINNTHKLETVNKAGKCDKNT